MVDIKIQTIYRESETQTFPWSPPYTQVSKELPEVLQLNNLKWKKGLPVGKYEVEEIVRNRKKRSWEMYLAENNEKNHFKQKIITQIEKDDWKFREKDLDQINEYRMELAKKVFEEQKDDFSNKLIKKINILNKNIQDRYEENMIKIEHEKDKKIRNINNMVKLRFNERHNKKTIIDKFMDRLDDLYAFKVRLGYQRKNTSVVLCQDAYIGLKTVKVKQKNFEPPNRAGKTKKHDCLKQYFIRGTDEEFDHYFKIDNKNIKEEILDKQESTRDDNLYTVDDKSIQSEILDLDDTSDSVDSEIVEKRRQLLLERYKDNCIQKYKTQEKNKHVVSVENSLLAKLLDVSSKEKQRFDEEKKILSIALVAQAERWRREAREAGMKQRQKMRQKIKQRILEQAYDQISEDIVTEFDCVLKDTFLSTAILEAEDEIRTTIYDIDRNTTPNFDDYYKQEETIVKFKQHLSQELEFEPDMIDEKTEKSMSDISEIIEDVEDLYEDVINISLNLDKILATLNTNNMTESQYNLVNEKIQNLFSNKVIQPTLERLRNETKDLYTNTLFVKETDQDIKKIDNLCDSVLDVAEELYENVIGDSDISEIMKEINSYHDSIVNDEYINYIDKNTSLYIFKLMKISHILSDKNKAKFITGNAFKVLKVAKQFCYRVTGIAGKIHNYLFSNEYKNEDKIEESIKSERTEESKTFNWKTSKDRLCEKLKIKFDNKMIKKPKIKNKIEEIKQISKIDVCKIREEAAEIIDSIIHIWLALDSLTNQLETADPDTKNEILNKLKCVIEKLQQQFGDIELLGFKDFENSIHSSKYKEETKDIVDQLLIASIKLNDMKEEGSIDVRNNATVLQDPLKSDIKVMIEHPEKYPAVHKLTQELN